MFRFIQKIFCKRNPEQKTVQESPLDENLDELTEKEIQDILKRGKTIANNKSFYSEEEVLRYLNLN